jgi:hypothetical protein
MLTNSTILHRFLNPPFCPLKGLFKPKKQADFRFFSYDTESLAWSDPEARVHEFSRCIWILKQDRNVSGMRGRLIDVNLGECKVVQAIAVEVSNCNEALQCESVYYSGNAVFEQSKAGRDMILCFA